MFRIVVFQSAGATLRGRFYAPPGPSGPAPGIVMAHGYSATINGMTADRYAEVFWQAGLAVLLYDHPNFGISGGEPRQQINRWLQTRGYLDAVSFMTTLPEVDATRLALWGDSMSGGEVIVAAALEERVRAVVAQVPACGDSLPPPDPDGRLFAALRETLLHGDLRGDPANTEGPLPVVSFDQHSFPSMLTPLTAFRWFIEYGGRYGTLWENWVTSSSPATVVPFHPFLCAPHLSAALMMLIAIEDEMPGASSQVARQVFEAAPGPKEVVDLEGGHFGILHYPSPAFDLASQAQRQFLLNYLLKESLP